MSRKGFSPDGLPLFFPTKSFSQPSVTMVSIDYSNRRTWWSGSQREIQTNLSADPLTGTVVNLPNSSNGIINVYEITEGLMVNHMYNPENYKVAVTLDSVDVSDLEYGFEAGMPDNSNPNAYVVDYEDGTITFNSSQSGKQIDVSYSVPVKGDFKLFPPSDKVWKVHHIELQFSLSHTTWQNPMEFVIGLKHPNVNGGAELEAQVRTYRGMGDILNYANLGTMVPASGELTQNIYQIPFNYLSGFTIYPLDHPFNLATSNSMNFMKLRLKYDIPIPNAEIATAAFYIFENELPQ